MAGHSHWARIKRQKAAVDKTRAKHFSKLAKAIMIAARAGGGDPDANLTLRYAIDRARAGNMTNDSIDRAIKKATGELGDRQFEDVTYEAYGPGGVAMMIEATTDNRARTAPELRNIFSRHGGNLANPGAVAFQFERKGLIGVPLDAASEDEVFEVAVEAGADDVQPSEEGYHISTSPQSFDAVKRACNAKGWSLTTAELAYVPQNMVQPDAETIPKVEALIEALENLDDVQNVFSNLDAPG
mgnify:CR=1 FL=1